MQGKRTLIGTQTHTSAASTSAALPVPVATAPAISSHWSQGLCGPSSLPSSSSVSFMRTTSLDADADPDDDQHSTSHDNDDDNDDDHDSHSHSSLTPMPPPPLSSLTPVESIAPSHPSLHPPPTRSKRPTHTVTSIYDDIEFEEAGPDASVLEEIQFIEEEENDREMSFMLRNSLSCSRESHTFMPYIL